MDREDVIKGIQECDLNGGLIGNCPYKGILALLKEQEPVEPIKDIARNRRCPKCFTILKGKFCHECGQAVKWV